MHSVHSLTVVMFVCSCLGTKGPELSFDVVFYTVGGALPSSLYGSVIATYSDEKGKQER